MGWSSVISFAVARAAVPADSGAATGLARPRALEGQKLFQGIHSREAVAESASPDGIKENSRLSGSGRQPEVRAAMC